MRPLELATFSCLFTYFKLYYFLKRCINTHWWNHQFFPLFIILLLFTNEVATTNSVTHITKLANKVNMCLYWKTRYCRILMVSQWKIFLHFWLKFCSPGQNSISAMYNFLGLRTPNFRFCPFYGFISFHLLYICIVTYVTLDLSNSILQYTTVYIQSLKL